MQISGFNDVLGSGEVKIPSGIDATTQEEKDLYRASLEFERVFVSHMLEKMESSAKLLSEGSGDEGGDIGGSTKGYGDMARDQMTQAVLDGGGLGLAGVLYGQMRAQLGAPATATEGGTAK